MSHLQDDNTNDFSHFGSLRLRHDLIGALCTLNRIYEERDIPHEKVAKSQHIPPPNPASEPAFCSGLSHNADLASPSEVA